MLRNIFNILGMKLILFQCLGVSRKMMRGSSSSAGSSSAENKSIERTREYLVSCLKTMKVLGREKLIFLHNMYSTNDETEQEISKILLTRLKWRYEMVERSYLDVLKGGPLPRSVENYSPGSEEEAVRRSVERGEPLPNLRRENSPLTVPESSSSRASRLEFLESIHHAISIKTYLRLKHDDTRAISRDLERALRNHAIMINLTARALYERSIERLKGELSVARREQEAVVLGRERVLLDGYYERGSEEGRLRREFSSLGLNYDHEHDFPGNRDINRTHFPSGSVLLNASNLLSSSSGDLTPRPSLISSLLRHFRFGRNHSISVNTALEESLDDIDILLKELREARVDQKRVRSGRAKEIYGRSIRRLEERIEMTRRYQDGIRSERTRPTPRVRYIPGTEELLVKTDFTRGGLDWDREHAGRG